MLKGLKAYQQTNLYTAKPDKILLMLYEGCIKFVRLAKQKMQEKKIADKGKYISKALAIVSELMNTLDHEVGGQISRDLESLYIFLMDKLMEANIHNCVADLECVEKVLCTLNEAWIDVVNNPRPDGVPSAALQPQLYDFYVKHRGVQARVSSKNQSNSVATAINLSQDAHPKVLAKAK